jgi:hypothetical protein
MSLLEEKNMCLLFQTETRKRCYGNLQLVKSVSGKGNNEQKSERTVGSKFKSFMTSVEDCILRHSFWTFDGIMHQEFLLQWQTVNQHL